MIEFSKNIYIERPPQEVWDFVSDPTNEPKWRESAASAAWVSEGPTGVGSRYKSVDKLMGRNVESEAEITAWEPPRSFSQKAIGGPIQFEATLTVEPDGNGTRVTFRGQAALGGFFKIAEGLAGKQLEKQMDVDIAGLKRFLEETSA